MFLIVCTGLDLGGSIPDGLASCGGGPSDRPSRSLRVAPAGFRPGTRPAHSGPARGSVDLISPQMLGELLGGVLAPPVRVEYRLPPVVCGRLRAAISIASHARGRCRVLSPQSRTRLLSSCSSPGTVARYTNPSQVRIQVDVAHPLHSRPVGGGSPAGPGRGASPGPGGRDGGAGSFRRGCAAWRALGAHDGAHRVRARLNASAGQGGVSTAVPVGAAGAVEDPLDQGAELFPASHGS